MYLDVIIGIACSAAVSVAGYIGILTIKWLKTINTSVREFQTYVEVQAKIVEHFEKRISNLEKNHN